MGMDAKWNRTERNGCEYGIEWNELEMDITKQKPDQQNGPARGMINCTYRNMERKECKKKILSNRKSRSS